MRHAPASFLTDKQQSVVEQSALEVHESTHWVAKACVTQIWSGLQFVPVLPQHALFGAQ
jgi:hypothetical protein